MRPTKTALGALTVMVLGAALALTGTASAQADVTGHWGTFTLDGTNRQYTGAVQLAGFPATTFTSNSRQSSVISGQSTWQGPSTPPGQVYGSSRGSTYLNQRPLQDQPRPTSASTTTYAFASPTPAGGWSFVLGDIDADQATITATGADGQPVSTAALGFASTYNSCSAAPSPGGWSCTPDPDGTTGRDVPTWDAASGVLTGNAAAADTAGATAWFSPTVPLRSLTITYQSRSGLPVYQTWFANTTAALSGSATLDGSPYPGATVTATRPDGTSVMTTTRADGTYTFPTLGRYDDWTVTVDRPTGAEGADTTATPVSLVGGDGSAPPFAFTSPPASTSIIGTVVDEDGDPVAGIPVTITPAGGEPVETTTNDGGAYVVAELPPNTSTEIAVPGVDPVVVETGAPGTPTAVPP
ncbi:MAG: carboxypeptidase regulatory-like domain-containing protein, partial [Williamsia herbipolensis]|nr:carboxypeptidase regulatory-like domain-containing protein [Williamsia herbipolensis]